MLVNVVCRNYEDDRVIPRFARYLRDFLGWTLTRQPAGDADAIYLSGYFEAQLLRPWPDVPIGAYFTHREEEPPGNAKAKLFDGVAQRVNLRIATAAMYAAQLWECGPTAQITPPVERDKFVIPPLRQAQGDRRLVVGFSGYTYGNGRKGEDLARALVASDPGQSVDWRASGRGWPVPTQKYRWEEMPGFYQSLDVLVVTSSVEGVPMPPLECMACGVSVVVPKGVGLLDELPECPGIYRYEKNQAKSCVRALRKALGERRDVDREKLRAVTAPYTITAWCEMHRQAFEEILL